MIPIGANLIIRTIKFKIIHEIVREGNSAQILRSRRFCIYPREKHCRASNFSPVPQLHTEKPANYSIHAHHMVQRSDQPDPIFSSQQSIMVDRDP